MMNASLSSSSSTNMTYMQLTDPNESLAAPVYGMMLTIIVTYIVIATASQRLYRHMFMLYLIVPWETTPDGEPKTEESKQRCQQVCCRECGLAPVELGRLYHKLWQDYLGAGLAVCLSVFVMLCQPDNDPQLRSLPIPFGTQGLHVITTVLATYYVIDLIHNRVIMRWKFIVRRLLVLFPFALLWICRWTGHLTPLDHHELLHRLAGLLVVGIPTIYINIRHGIHQYTKHTDLSKSHPIQADRIQNRIMKGVIYAQIFVNWMLFRGYTLKVKVIEIHAWLSRLDTLTAWYWITLTNARIVFIPSNPRHPIHLLSGCLLIFVLLNLMWTLEILWMAVRMAANALLQLVKRTRQQHHHQQQQQQQGGNEPLMSFRILWKKQKGKTQ